MADQELKACLPSLAPEIGALLRRPGLIHDLHAAEPYAAASIVMALLGVPYGLPVSLYGVEQHAQLFRHMRGAADHCLQ